MPSIRAAPLRTWIRLASVLGIVALTGCGSGESEVTETRAEPELSPRAGRPIEVGGTPVAIATDDSGVWVVDNSGGSLLRLDPRRPEDEPKRLPIAGGPSAVAIGEGAVWVASGDGSITRVDPVSGKASRLDLRVTQPGGIAAGEGSVWVTSSAANQLVRIDPASGETVGDPIDVGEFPVDVAVGDGSVWVANTRDGTVSRVDAETGEASDPIEVAVEEVSALAVGEDGVWIAKSDDKLGEKIEVAHVDPSTETVEGAPATVDAGIPVRVAAGEGGVWTTLIGGVQPAGGDKPPGVVLIDPDSGQAVTTISVGDRPSGITTGAGAVWVANAGDGTVTRIDPGAGSPPGLSSEEAAAGRDHPEPIGPRAQRVLTEVTDRRRFLPDHRLSQPLPNRRDRGDALSGAKPGRSPQLLGSRLDLSRRHLGKRLVRLPRVDLLGEHPGEPPLLPATHCASASAFAAIAA